MPKRPLALIGAIHEEERYKTWIKAVRQENPDKIEPLKGWYMFISRIWKNAVEYGGIVSAMLPANKPAITEVIPLNDYSLQLYYTTGGYRVSDVGPLLNGEALQKLKNMEIFRNAQLHETVSWCDGNIDIAPETLYLESRPVHSGDIDALIKSRAT